MLGPCDGSESTNPSAAIASRPVKTDPGASRPPLRHAFVALAGISPSGPSDVNTGIMRA